MNSNMRDSSNFCSNNSAPPVPERQTNQGTICKEQVKICKCFIKERPVLPVESPPAELIKMSTPAPTIKPKKKCCCCIRICCDDGYGTSQRSQRKPSRSSY